MKKEKRTPEKMNPRSAKGMGTVEIVIIIAILVSLALIFSVALSKYSSTIMSYVFDDENVIDQLKE